MSESSNTSPDRADQDNGSSEPGAINDEDLPEDLRPEENPLARDPGDEDESTSSGP